MKQAISTEQSDSNIREVIRTLADTPVRLERLGSSLSQEQTRLPSAEGERSFVENLAHLINSEARQSEAIYLALLLEEPRLHDVHSERQWGKLLRYDLLAVPELLAYFRLRREVLLRVLKGLTPEQWARCVQEERKKRKESVYWRARSLALHEGEHLSDLQYRLNK